MKFITYMTIYITIEPTVPGEILPVFLLDKIRKIVSKKCRKWNAVSSKSDDFKAL